MRAPVLQSGSLGIGVLLWFNGTYAPLGEAIMRSLELYTNSHGGKPAGRGVSFIKVDDEFAPPEATELTTKLIKREKPDILIGTVPSGVAMTVVKIAREGGIPTIVANAGPDIVTRAMCAENVFRTSFAKSRIGRATGDSMIKAGHRKAVTVSWKYAAGAKMIGGSKKAFAAGRQAG